MSYNYKLENPQFFAPVVIPTLCRYDHFKQCLESLMRCTWADKTDVYIGLDYPAKESHWDGYKKICSYLKGIEESHGFKSLNVIKREHNFGFGPKGNFATLRDYVFSFSDRLIASEDDNIFSPAFLDYINKGLEIFKDDKDVIAICGYRNYYDFKFGDNTIAKQSVDFLAWGYGYWKDRAKEISLIKPRWFREQFSIIKFIRFCKSNGNYRGLSWLQFALRPAKNFTMPDDGISVYMALKDKYTIMPSETLVRNIGTDGTGEHFKQDWPELTEKLRRQKLFDKTTFHYQGDLNAFYEYNMAVNVRCAYNRIPSSRFPYMIVKMFFDKAFTWYKRRHKKS